MNEEINEVVADGPPDIPEVSNAPGALTGPDEPDVPHTSRVTRWVAPAWFFFGLVVGVAAFAAYTAFLAPKPVAPAAATVATLDPALMREAARTGVLEAIATLQAGGGQQQQPAAKEQGPQPVSADAFAVREANRLGEQTAKVTVYEFSDFQ